MPETAAAAKQIRGSTLLLVGRLLSLGISFGIQVLIVRYLSKTSYGAFAYALSIAIFAQTLVTFGVDRAVTRFIPIYDEQRMYGRIFGVLAIVIGTVVSLGLTLTVAVYGLHGLIRGTLIQSPEAVSLLLILILLAPLQAVDELLTGLFAVFSKPRVIFFRRYVLTPGLRLLVVLLLVLGEADVFFLAVGYVAAGAVGLAISIVLLVRTLRDVGLLDRFDIRSVDPPVREMFSFTIPLLTTDLVYATMVVSDAVLLGYFHGASDVAALRAVQPAAQLNQLVFSTFLLLFTPVIARLFARNDREGINDLYWQTTGWIAVISFPIFLLTFSLADPLTVLLFGTRYAESAILLAVLSLGYYFQAALGFNGTTLMVFGRIRYIVVLNLLAVLVNLGLNLLLIPSYGALGAAVATSGTLIAHNVLKQSGLRLGTGISLFDRRYGRVYATIVVATAAVLLVGRATDTDVARFAFAAATSLVVFALNRQTLRVSETFPELARLPLAGRLVR